MHPAVHLMNGSSFRWKRSGLDGKPVWVALIIAAVVPAVCVLWFMAQARLKFVKQRNQVLILNAEVRKVLADDTAANSPGLQQIPLFQRKVLVQEIHAACDDAALKDTMVNRPSSVNREVRAKWTACRPSSMRDILRRGAVPAVVFMDNHHRIWVVPSRPPPHLLKP